MLRGCGEKECCDARLLGQSVRLYCEKGKPLERRLTTHVSV